MHKFRVIDGTNEKIYLCDGLHVERHNQPVNWGVCKLSHPVEPSLPGEIGLENVKTPLGAHGQEFNKG